jgi:hypothetical protein
VGNFSEQLWGDSPERRHLRRGTGVEAVLAEISAINAELLARRELR